jgi:putative intracellular protease/amidase
LEPHFTIEWASPKGGKAPLDPSSVENFKDDEESKQLLADNKAKQGYENTKKLSDINANDYVALLYVGGHGPCFDLAEDKTNIKLAEEFWKQGKVVSAVCHGPAALGLTYFIPRKKPTLFWIFLVNVKDENGKSIFAGRKATAFGNTEEEEIKLTDAIPFLVETRLKELGANYERNDKTWGPWVSVDGQRLFCFFRNISF